MTWPIWPLWASRPWQPPTSMKAWHRRNRFCRTLSNIPGSFQIVSQAATVLGINSMSESTGIWVYVSPNISGLPSLKPLLQIFMPHLFQLMGQVAQAARRLATDRMARVRFWMMEGWRLFFTPCPTGPGVHPASCKTSYRGFPGGIDCQWRI